MNQKLAKEIRRKAKRLETGHRKDIAYAIIEVCTWEFRYRVRVAWKILRGARKKAKR